MENKKGQGFIKVGIVGQTIRGESRINTLDNIQIRIVLAELEIMKQRALSHIFKLDNHGK
jgi:hypothetical protein